MTAIVAPAASASVTSAEGRKAVIIVGPASGSTSEYLQQGEKIARQAEAEGMDVVRIFTPHATWARVKANIQNANLVVYLGHGNGWPSTMGPFRPESKDGLGLNYCDGTCGTSSPTKYFGEQFIRDEVKLAPNAVVFLHRLCYASGNAESGMAPVFDKDLATQRASNFASGFLDAGAGVVFALGWRQAMNLPKLLAESDETMDEIFMTKATSPQWYDGFIGADDYYRDSTRTPGARVHLDPHPRFGTLRAITGNLDLTADEWRGDPPPPDDVPPTLRVRGAETDGAVADAGDPIVFTPNGDKVSDQVVIDRVLSEPAWIDIQVRNAAGDLVRDMTRYDGSGDGTTTWDGRNNQGGYVRDGRYEISLTPRDRARNVGDTKVVVAKVLTMLEKQRSSAGRIAASDGDPYAAGVTLSTKLDQDAKVTWVIKRNDFVVRTHLDAKPTKAGALTWRWDGKNDAGDYVPDGDYTAVVAATTDAGTLTYRTDIGVGNWVTKVDDQTPIRGQTIRLEARSTEELKNPVVTYRQPGLEPVSQRMKAADAHTSIANLKLAKGGKTGLLVIVVTGKDKGGNVESVKIRLKLR
ncbi:MAG: FlgD immunoglobulin-like domain containing protein [Chloroflexota bacterium]